MLAAAVNTAIRKIANRFLKIGFDVNCIVCIYMQQEV
jgi:hypothetical protein